MPSLTLQQLESHLWGAADILRGSVDAGACMTYIVALLRSKIIVLKTDKAADHA